jgi:sodium-dependent dicarboxylate transporter 2/3/5
MNLIKAFFTNRALLRAIFAIGVSAAAWFFMPADVGEPARRMAFIFVLSALFWAMEIVPLHTTAFIVILLEILLLCRPGGVMNATANTYQQFLTPFGSPTIMLFFGGLVLAVALSKYEIDRLIARKLLGIFGSSPYFIMVGFMAVTAFLSMWMSNTATTAMMIAMLMPLLKQIDKSDPFRVGLVLAIPFAANIGGIATPVGTPPNAVAIGILANNGITLSFIGWMKMAFPLAVILLSGASLLLYALYPARNKSVSISIDGVKKMDHNGVLCVMVALVTIGLWLTSELHKIPEGVIALLAVGMFYSFHLLDKADLKKVEWDVLILMWGGLALGKGMEITGLTGWIVGLPFFDQTGILLVAIFAVVAVFLSTFMSNTATANLMIPIVMAVPGENSLLLAIVMAMACSFAMALPISTPPNAIAFSTDMIKSGDMFKAGALISVISIILMLIGYQIIIPAAFGM